MRASVGELEMTGKKNRAENDLLIAATALANNAVLVTNNVDEFKRVPGLSLVLVRDGVGRISVRRLVSRSIISGSPCPSRNARRTHA